MYQRENSNFTGFRVHYEDGTIVNEFRLFPNKPTTNWRDIDKSRIHCLELYHGGILKKAISRDVFDVDGGSWFYSHSGCMDINKTVVTIVCRNIGFSSGGVYTIYSVNEETGTLTESKR